MVCNILYLINSAEVISEVCGELATIIVENKASRLDVGMYAFVNGTCKQVEPLQKLSVHLVEKLRTSAHAVYEEVKYEPVNDEAFVETARLVVKDSPRPITAAVIFAEKNHAIVDYHDEASTDKLPLDILGKGRSREIGPRAVKLVKAFDGDFTVGDPNEPLLSIPVCFYPATRHASPIDLANYVGDRRVVQSSTLKTESGAEVDPASVEKGYSYLNELVTVDKGVQNLMNGEFPGAERWTKAFELLATVPKVPPWIPLERTDQVIGKNEAAKQFLAAFCEALQESQMHAIARLCRDPSRGENGELKHKGKLELVVLQPSTDDDGNRRLLCSPLPFREDFRYYYRFFELPSEPEDAEERQLDDEMDDLVDAMTTKMPPAPQRNALIERVARYVRDRIADSEAEVPPVRPLPATKFSEDVQAKSRDLMSKFGIVERVTNGKADNSKDPDTNGKESAWDLEFI